MKTFALCLLLILLAFAEPQALPTVPVRLGTTTFTLQIANDPDERATGLMHVEAMPQQGGMIFVFPQAARRTFWMKDTLIPLDILFLSAGGRVLNVERMVPGNTDDPASRASSAGPAKWVIELNAGMAKAAGVRPGDVIRIPPAARRADDAR
jgi:uncharacterized membrane protein (UPF0127 family)